MARNPAFTFLIVLMLLLALAGCGVGGGSGPGGIPVHGGEVVVEEDFDEAVEAAAAEIREDPSFRDQWYLAYINADEAYANLSVLRGPDAEPGAGVTIGIMHAGIDLGHSAFAGKNVTEVFLDGAVDETGADAISFGTGVASIAAGVKIDVEGIPHGVAWGADVAMFAIPTRLVSTAEAEPLAVLASIDARDAARYERMLSWRDGDRKVDILAFPFGLSAGIDGFTEQELRDNYGRAIDVLAQEDAEEKTILVWAAGELRGARCEPAGTENCRYGFQAAVSPIVMAGLAAHVEELQGHSIVVAGVSAADGEISWFSSRCGIAADYCIAAPADHLGVAYFGPFQGQVIRTYWPDYWTQYSAGIVSGGLAIMKQLFRDQLSNTELVARLLDTADDSGVYADRAVYGRGLLDLGAATSPVGVLRAPSGAGVGRDGIRLASTSFSPGTAFGDGLQRSLASREVMALDGLGAPFWYRLGDFAGAGAGPSVTARLRGFLAAGETWPGGAGGAALARRETGRGAAGVAGGGRGTEAPRVDAERVEASADVDGGHMSLAQGGVRATLGGSGGLSAAAFTSGRAWGRRPVVGAGLTWRRAGSPVGVRAGWIGERRTLLGSVGEGAFGGLGADTSYLGLDAGTMLGGWRLGAKAELGLVVPEARGGWLERVSSLATSAFGVHASRALGGEGMVRFSVSQPLRVERGRARLRVPVGRTRGGAVVYDAVGAGLEPSGRQVDVAGEWRRPAGSGELRLGAVYSHRPGHREDAGPELTFLGGWRWGF